jgi:hypothetical protein
MIIDKEYFKQFHGYHEFETPITFDGFEAIGMFEYRTASIQTEACIPRTLFFHIEEKLNQIHHKVDNKSVIIFRDTERFGTTNFAINFHDMRCRTGTWEEVVGYGGRELTLELEYQKTFQI